MKSWVQPGHRGGQRPCLELYILERTRADHFILGGSSVLTYQMGGNFSPHLVPSPEQVSKYSEVSLHRSPFLHQIYLGLTLTLAFTTLSPDQAASDSHLGSPQPPCPPPPVYSGDKGLWYSISQFVSLLCSGPSDSSPISFPRAKVPSGSGPADLVQIQLPALHTATLPPHMAGR